MINLSEVGALPSKDAAGNWTVNFGIYLPGITFNKGYRLKVRIIHEIDQFIRGIEPAEFFLNWQNGSALDLWNVTVSFATAGVGHFGQEGKYLYRFELVRGAEEITFWFGDPFARATGLGTLSAFTLSSTALSFVWNDNAFQVPEVDQMVAYELHVEEFNQHFDGLIDQLDYLYGLGVNVLELMPVTNVKEKVEWGYTPLGYFAPDERIGGPDGMRRLVDACHARGMAVILDAVYAHAHPEFPYNLVYDTSGEPNPMMGAFAGEFFSQLGTDYRKQFTRDYFLEVNKYWLSEYHLDGFRYDYVPGFYDGPAGQGYAELVYNTYQHSKAITRFQAANGRSRIIQCAENLPDPQGILASTYTNTCWQNALFDEAWNMAKYRYANERFAHLLDPQFVGYPSGYTNPATGDSFPVAPFQYIESHDHSRFITQFGLENEKDLLGQAYGNRNLFYKMQPFVVALYTGKGIPMLWQGQEFAEDWSVPDRGIGRNLFMRPVHWEYFYDANGKALVRLYRVMGELRRKHRALSSRGFFFYYNDPNHTAQSVIAFRREAAATATQPSETLIVILNFSDVASDVWIPWPSVGQWVEQIDLATAAPNSLVNVNYDDQWIGVTVPSNYGSVYLKS
jgi:1,4-alpha-glucan branching enzyme